MRGWMSKMIVLLALSAGCERVDGGGPGSLDEAHRSALADSARVVLLTYVDRVNAGDWEAVKRFYAHDPSFRWLEDGGIAYESAHEVAAAFDSLAPALADLRVDVADVHVVPLAPGVAEVDATYEQLLRFQDGTEVPLAGAISMILVRSADGWRFLVGHSSTRRERGPAREASE